MSFTDSADVPGFREFQIQRAIVLGSFNIGSNHSCDAADLYAWSNGVFPLFSSSYLHKGFEAYFHPTEEMMSTLAARLDEPFMNGTIPPTVYDLEREMGIRHTTDPWDRSDLILALRYFSLCRGRFNEDFWPTMTRDSGAPAEANGFFRPFDPDLDASPH